MNPLPGQLRLPRQQVEAALQMFRAKYQLQKEMLEAHMDRSIKERALITGFLNQQGFATTSNPVGVAIMKEWQLAHIRQDKAQEELMRVTMAELDSQVKIHEGMLAQADNKIVPGGHLG